MYFVFVLFFVTPLERTFWEGADFMQIKNNAHTWSWFQKATLRIFQMLIQLLDSMLFISCLPAWTSHKTSCLFMVFARLMSLFESRALFESQALRYWSEPFCVYDVFVCRISMCVYVCCIHLFLIFPHQLPFFCCEWLILHVCHQFNALFSCFSFFREIIHCVYIKCFLFAIASYNNWQQVLILWTNIHNGFCVLHPITRRIPVVNGRAISRVSHTIMNFSNWRFRVWMATISHAFMS